ncbi:unnamed protein product [Urochloa decumbens]|uniref:NB-ARC domain-containing protein n=1 Tax=Urochloa decumbens TaxID=240449 RepID=A0ABC8YPQ0_9POAL
MEALVSAVLGDLISRSISFSIDKCYRGRRDAPVIEDILQRLRRVLLRIRITVEEAERRRVTNWAMLRQLQLMREGLYRGYYVLNAYNAKDDPEVSCHDRRSPFALSQFNPAKRVRVCTLSSMASTKMSLLASGTGREAEAELQEVLVGLERMASDMKELVVFLGSYPLLSREPYSGHLWLQNRMFGREAEQERIISFLLEPEPPGSTNLGVLPVIGRARVGKSTLVEHVCFDERVRKHFSSIVFLGIGDIDDGKLSPQHLGGNKGIIKHQDLDSAGKSLVVIELDGHMDESTLRRMLSTLRGARTAHVSKIVVTSRSEKIANFGTTQTLQLKPLPREAFWYFFKTIAFGSTDTEDHAELASVCMEMAGLLNRSFIGAYIIGSLLRANPCSQFWRKVLTRYRDFTRMHFLLFGEHPSDLIAKDRPAYLWRLASKTGTAVIVYRCYQACSAREHDLPKITINEVQIGSASPRGKFEVLAWRSHIPPYYNYVLSCEVRTSSSSLCIPARNMQIRGSSNRRCRGSI